MFFKHVGFTLCEVWCRLVQSPLKILSQCQRTKEKFGLSMVPMARLFGTEPHKKPELYRNVRKMVRILTEQFACSGAASPEKPHAPPLKLIFTGTGMFPGGLLVLAGSRVWKMSGEDSPPKSLRKCCCRAAGVPLTPTNASLAETDSH